MAMPRMNARRILVTELSAVLLEFEIQGRVH